MAGKHGIMIVRLSALIALALVGGCASLRFEPAANWLSAGGRLCAAETPFSEFDRAAPRSCLLAEAAEPAGAKAGLSNSFSR
jgi:hypothetical protein